MKPHFIIIIIFCVFSVPANGQFSVGVRADANMSGFWGSPITNANSSMQTGGSAGIFFKYKWHEYRVIQTELMFSFRTSEVKNQNTGETADYRYFGIELPLYSMLQIETGDQKIYAGFGGFVSVGLYSNCHNINLYRKSELAMRRWDFGTAVTIGYEMKNRLQFNINSKIGLRNLVSNGFDNKNMLSLMVGLGVGYRF